MDILVAILFVVLAYFIIQTLNLSLYTILIVLAIVALCVYIYRNSNRRRL